MSYYDFLSSLRLRDDRLKTDSKHFSDLNCEIFRLLKICLEGTPTKHGVVQYLQKQLKTCHLQTLLLGNSCNIRKRR